MRYVYIALIATLTAIVLLFKIQNLGLVTVSLLSASFTLPASVLLLLTYGLGMLTGGFVVALVRSWVRGARRTSTGTAALLAAVALAGVGCQAKAPAPETKAAPTPAAPVRVSGVGFATPESVLHDTTADVYLVSNINGSPLEKDDNGFVSRVSPDGTVLDLKWIDGAGEGVTLSAPKGMAIAGDTLYVTDIDALRLFDRATGAPKGEIAIEGATFLNDLAFAPAGGVYLTDSGLKAGASGFEPSGSAAVYHVHADGKVETLLEDATLPGPNGVAFDGERVLVVTFGANELFTIEGGAKKVLASLPKGGLDGLARLPDGRWAVSSWEGQAVYAGPVAGPFAEMAGGLAAPADIGVDAGRGRLLVPKFTENEVLILPIAP